MYFFYFLEFLFYFTERIEQALRNHDAYANGKNDGEIIGKDIGIEKNRNEMIVNMNKLGISLDLISKSSGLSIDEVKEIIDKESNINDVRES